MTTSFEIAGERFSYRFRAALFRAVLKQEIGYFDLEENNLGALTSRLAVDSMNVHELVTKTLSNVLQIIATVLIGRLSISLHVPLVILTSG